MEKGFCTWAACMLFCLHCKKKSNLYHSVSFIYCHFFFWGGGAVMEKGFLYMGCMHVVLLYCCCPKERWKIKSIIGALLVLMRKGNEYMYALLYT